MSNKKKQDETENQEIQDAAQPAAGETAEKAVAQAQPEETPEEKLGRQLAEKQNQLLALAAEYDNFRKRSQKEREGIYADAKLDTVKPFLPVMDNFERAMDSGESDAESLKKGLEMTLEQFRSVFAQLGAEAYGEVGDAFDPNFYNAVMHVEDDSIEGQQVVEVFQKGYKLGDKILREAMVKVAN